MPSTLPQPAEPPCALPWRLFERLNVRPSYRGRRGVEFIVVWRARALPGRAVQAAWPGHPKGTRDFAIAGRGIGSAAAWVSAVGAAAWVSAVGAAAWASAVGAAAWASAVGAAAWVSAVGAAA